MRIHFCDGAGDDSNGDDDDSGIWQKWRGGWVCQCGSAACLKADSQPHYHHDEEDAVDHDHDHDDVFDHDDEEDDKVSIYLKAFHQIFLSGQVWEIVYSSQTCFHFP